VIWDDGTVWTTGDAVAASPADDPGFIDTSNLAGESWFSGSTITAVTGIPNN
jgi:hypothetical protein